MIVHYRYRDKLFFDVREVTENEKLEPDYDYILNEYIPFQVFITGRTIWKGLTVEPTFRYVWKEQVFDGKSVERLLEEEAKQHYADHRKAETIAAVSGGLDSSTVALAFESPSIYTGYYSEEGFDETPLARQVAKAIPAAHHTEELMESDFVDNLYTMPGIFGVPIGGMGSIMEWATLQRVLRKVRAGSVLFGNGGDEVFLGYFFNRLAMSFRDSSRNALEGMVNFQAQHDIMVPRVLDYLIASSIDRAGLCWDSNVRWLLILALRMCSTGVVEKLLHVNINYTLPSLLHLNQQMCRSLGVEGVNPFASDRFLSRACSFNRPPLGRPKEALRRTSLPLHKTIRNNEEKKGFPIPFWDWGEAHRIVEREYKEFFERPSVAGAMGEEPPVYRGIDRFSWAVAQANIFLKHSERKR